MTINLSDIEDYQWQIRNKSPLSCSGLIGNELSLAAAIELLATVEYHSIPDLWRSFDLQFATCPIWNMIGQIRHRGLRRASRGTVSMSQIPPAFDAQWLADEVRLFRSTLLANRFPKPLAVSLTGGVFEMVDNVWKHSRCPQSGVFAYQVHRRSFSFAVYDSGVGVLSSLKRNPAFAHLRTSVEALEEAVKPNVSAIPSGSGLGFSQLVRALADLWGRTRLRSGQGSLTFNRETETPEKSPAFLPDVRGFQISGICRLK